MFQRKNSSLSVTEPHPSVPKSGAYLYGGRGGAGNYKRYNSTDVTSGPSATGPASRVPLPRASITTRVVPTGRGGAGNMTFKPSTVPEDNIFQFDEEMVRKREAQVAPVYHIGRGGAGNRRTDCPRPTSSAVSSRKDSSESSASEGERVAISSMMRPQRRGSAGMLSIFSRRSSTGRS